MQFYSIQLSLHSLNDHHNKRIMQVSFILRIMFYFQSSYHLAYTRVQLEDIANGIYKNASYLTYHAHGEWTRQSAISIE